jgi:hypothetical protein
VKYLTVQEITYTGPGSCDARFAPLMEALLAIEENDPAVTDPDIAADVSTGRVDIQMIVDAADPAAAMTDPASVPCRYPARSGLCLPPGPHSQATSSLNIAVMSGSVACARLSWGSSLCGSSPRAGRFRR